MDINKHKFFMMQVLKDIYNDKDLSTCLGFKGGTALMFFYNLPRFSVDLDFNLLDKSKEKKVYEKVRTILQKYGKIFDEALKFYGPVIVLDYGIGERKLKVEISNREFDNHYEIKNLLGIQVLVLVESDMFAHKLCALLDRSEITSRDIFDCWFFLQNHSKINAGIVESRMSMPLADYIQQCIERLETTSDKSLMSGLGELTDAKMKSFVRTKLRKETIQLLQFLKAFPALAHGDYIDLP